MQPVWQDDLAKTLSKIFQNFCQITGSEFGSIHKKVAKVAQSFCQKVNQLYKNLPKRKNRPNGKFFCHIWSHWILCKQHLLSFLLPYLIWLGSFNGSSWRSLRPPPPWSSQPWYFRSLFSLFSSSSSSLAFLRIRLWPNLWLQAEKSGERKKERQRTMWKNCWRAFFKYFYNCH